MTWGDDALSDEQNVNAFPCTDVEEFCYIFPHTKKTSFVSGMRGQKLGCDVLKGARTPLPCDPAQTSGVDG